LENLKRDIAILSTDYAANRRYLDDALTMLADPARLYAESDPDTKRLASQTFFRRIFVEDASRVGEECEGLDHPRTVHVQYEQPYSLFRDPELAQDAEEYSLVTAKSG